MEPYDSSLTENPFLARSIQSPWWLREATETELETHRRLIKQLQDLETHDQTP